MKARWLWLVGPWLAFLLAAAGWIAYWHVVANAAEAQLSDWVRARNASGAEARVGRVLRHGFPVLLRLELRDVAYAPTRAGWRLSTERADLHVDLFNTSHIVFQARAPIEFARNGAVASITAEGLIASVRNDANGLAQAGVEANALVIDDPEAEGVLSFDTLVINLRPDPRTPEAYQVSLQADNVGLPRTVRGFESFGQDIAQMRALVVVDEARMLLSTEQGDPLGPWREAGGRLRFDALALAWGPLATTGDGEVRLDAERRLAGALQFPIEEPAPIFRALARDPGVSADARQGLELLAGAFALSGDDLTLDVEGADGVLRLEGLRVRELPPVY